MKRILLIVACIIAISTGKAQDSVVYKSVLGDSIAEWYVLQAMFDGGDGRTGNYTIATEDTVILSDTIYNIYRCDEMYSEVGCGGFQGFPGDFRNYDKYMRESDDRSKLYFRTSLSNTEILLMDLNLEVGDTVDTKTWIWDGVSYNDTAIVVDSVYYHNDMKHIRTNYYTSFKRPYTSDNIYDTLKFIEGIGPSFGITYIPSVMLAVNGSYFTYTVICYYRDEISEYRKIPNEWSCYVRWWMNINDVDNISATIYPNPIKDKVFITNLTAEEHTIKIISQMGIVVKCITTYGSEIEIDLKELPSGVYNIVITNSNGLTTKKIIKL